MKRCLIADNSAVIRKVAAHYLAENHWVVDEAETAAQVLAAVAAHSPELVIIDWQLSGMDALELIRSLRDHDQARSARIIYLTTEQNRREFWRAEKAGADDHLVKPFDRTSMMAMLKVTFPRPDLARPLSAQPA